jgi:hypothetical protein
MRKTLRSGPIESVRRPPPEAADTSASHETHASGTSLEAQLVELEQVSLDDLRLRWRNHWGRRAPAHLSRGLLLRVMAYRLQAEAFGDLDRKTVRMLDRLADDAAGRFASNGSSTPSSDNSASAATSPGRQRSDPLILKPGTLLTREWRGRIERVTVISNGFAWDGASYTSLSAAAFAITGTKWNGHRFFGVRHRNRIRASERDGDANHNDQGEGSSALARGKVDHRRLAAGGKSSPSVSTKKNAPARGFNEAGCR